MKKKTCYIQEKMAKSWKFLAEQNLLTLYLIQPLNGGGVRGGRVKTGEQAKGAGFQ